MTARGIHTRLGGISPDGQTNLSYPREPALLGRERLGSRGRVIRRRIGIEPWHFVSIKRVPVAKPTASGEITVVTLAARRRTGEQNGPRKITRNKNYESNRNWKIVSKIIFDFFSLKFFLNLKRHLYADRLHWSRRDERTRTHKWRKSGVEKQPSLFCNFCRTSSETEHTQWNELVFVEKSYTRNYDGTKRKLASTLIRITSAPLRKSGIYSVRNINIYYT